MLAAKMLAVSLLFSTVQAYPGDPCGLSPQDWCPPPASDPCSMYNSERSCRADKRCEGLPYRGESVMACIPDGTGFWTNCPAVGCRSRTLRVPAK